MTWICSIAVIMKWLNYARDILISTLGGFIAAMFSVVLFYPNGTAALPSLGSILNATGGIYFWTFVVVVLLGIIYWKQK